ncbi:MAG: DUF2336 domain-containing protein [Pseudomonadota bacterium]
MSTDRPSFHDATGGDAPAPPPPPPDAAAIAAVEAQLDDQEAGEARAMRTAVGFTLADLIVLPAGRISANERSVCADMLLQVLMKLDEDERADIARRISRVAECPPALMRFFLLDTPIVAEPILRDVDHAPDALLIECAREGVTAHRAHIAKRTNVSSSVIDALVEFAEVAVARTILQRSDVTLSPIAVERLVAISAGDPELQTALLRRREIEPAHGFLMFWWVRGERRRRILSRFSIDRGVIQEAFRDLYPKVFQADAPDPVVKEILVMNDRRHQPRGPNGDRLSPDMVKKALSLAYKNPTQEAIAAVAIVAGVSRELAGRILRDEDGEPYAVLCKASGISRDDFYSFVLMGEDGGAERADPSDVSEEARERAEDLLAVFDAMARDFSRAVMRYWDWKGNPRLSRVSVMMEGGDLTA